MSLRSSCLSTKYGPTVSSVCLGTWPRQAVRGDLEPAYNDPKEKRSLEQIASRAPADELIVLSPGLPAVNKEFQTSHGRVRTVPGSCRDRRPVCCGPPEERRGRHRPGSPRTSAASSRKSA